MKSGLFVIVMLCLSVSGCIKQREKSPKETQSNAAFSFVQKGWQALAGDTKKGAPDLPDQTIIESSEFQAILKDISLPIAYHAVAQEPFFEKYGPDEYRLCFTTSITLNELLSFYRQEMELAGWREWSISYHNQLNAIFKKPHHIAIINARSFNANSLLVTIMVNKRIRKNHG